jgi:hypoxanthine phosphoribosyltransferase
MAAKKKGGAKSAKKPAKAARKSARPTAKSSAKAPAKPAKSRLASSAPSPYAPPRETMIVEWTLFGELSRALALRVSRHFDPDLVVGVATAGVVPAAAIASMLDRPFHSIIVSRRFRSAEVRDTPAVLSGAPSDVVGRKVLIVDETCTSGDTIRLAKAAIINAGASEVRTAVSFKTGDYRPDYFALETEARIVLPWDREQIVNGELRLNPKYADLDDA